jgi:NADH-quinone oxidoreductase subunit M
VAKYLPAYIGFFGLFAFSSFGFPGTNSFVGELLVFIGAFQSKIWVGAAMVPGVLLAAAYMLRLTQKLSWGEPSSVKGWKDLNRREWAYLLPCAVFVIYIGLAPRAFFNTIDASVKGLLSNFHARTAEVYISENTVHGPLQISGEGQVVLGHGQPKE